MTAAEFVLRLLTAAILAHWLNGFASGKWGGDPADEWRGSVGHG